MTENPSQNDQTQQNSSPDYVSAQSFDRLSAAFENSARRWELIVYPSLFAFVLLAVYGFYLIYRLANDVHYLAISVDTNMTALAGNMQSVSENMYKLTDNMNTMTASMQSINGKIGTLEPMLTNMNAIEKSLQGMTYATHNIRDDMSHMSNNISRPMGFMNTFMPW